jgi:hypothetical protein
VQTVKKNKKCDPTCLNIMTNLEVSRIKIAARFSVTFCLCFCFLQANLGINVKGATVAVLRVKINTMAGI